MERPPITPGRRGGRPLAPEPVQVVVFPGGDGAALCAGRPAAAGKAAVVSGGTDAVRLLTPDTAPSARPSQAHGVPHSPRP